MTFKSRFSDTINKQEFVDYIQEQLDHCYKWLAKKSAGIDRTSFETAADELTRIGEKFAPEHFNLQSHFKKMESLR